VDVVDVDVIVDSDGDVAVDEATHAATNVMSSFLAGSSLCSI
jgi:hypothetical protein